MYWKQVEIFLLHRQIFSLVLRKLAFLGLYFTQKSLNDGELCGAPILLSLCLALKAVTLCLCLPLRHQICLCFLITECSDKKDDVL